MPRITYRHHDGATEVHDVPIGSSVMHGAVSNGIDEIVAECGGAAQCGTCHVYVIATSGMVLSPMHEIEDEVLHCTTRPRRDSSRLSCQLVVTTTMDGLVVDLPELGS